MSAGTGPEHREAEFGTSLRNVQMVTTLLLLSGREDVEAFAKLLHPEFRVVAIPGLAPARGFQSRDEFLDYFAQARSMGQHIEPDISSITVMPNGAIIVAGRLRVTVDRVVDDATVMPAWFVYTFRDGLIATLGNYLTADMADEAALAASA